jgi:creatinine amidohydrolase/Fe(II)-dependent formamide hydrolase-like protein
MGLDLLEAEKQCELAAERLEREMPGWAGVILPPAPLGIDSDTTALALTVRAHVLRDWLADSCRALMKAGFTHFVCFSGHLGPKQLTAVEEAAKLVGRRALTGWIRAFLGPAANRLHLVSASSALVSAKQVRESPWMPDPSEHGGARDTSVALALEPQSVRETFRELPNRPRELHWRSRLALRLRGRLSGYWGDPSKATAESGQAILKGEMDEIFPKLRAVWEGANANALFRSWYSIIPIHKSFFKAWFLTGVIVCVMLIWVYLNLRAMVGL